jgi:hypothetical protein
LVVNQIRQFGGSSIWIVRRLRAMPEDRVLAGVSNAQGVGSKRSMEESSS